MTEGARRRLARGDVVSRGSLSGVVWGVGAASIAILPLIPHAADVRRNDVPIRGWADIVSVGRGGTDLAIRPAAGFTSSAAGWAITGKLTSSLMAELSRAVSRELADAVTIDRWQWRSKHRA